MANSLPGRAAEHASDPRDDAAVAASVLALAAEAGFGR
jgi:hypothetical protein